MLGVAHTRYTVYPGYFESRIDFVLLVLQIYPLIVGDAQNTSGALCSPPQRARRLAEEEEVGCYGNAPPLPHLLRWLLFFYPSLILFLHPSLSDVALSGVAFEIPTLYTSYQI